MKMLSRWEPKNEMTQLQDQMNQFFSDLWGGGQWPVPAMSSAGAWLPSVDVLEEGDHLVVKADLPGVKKEDLDITATEDGITISARTEDKKQEAGKDYYRSERRSGRFLRTIPLPKKVNVDKANAVFQDGIVTITLPKAAGPANGKKIAVTA